MFLWSWNVINVLSAHSTRTAWIKGTEIHIKAMQTNKNRTYWNLKLIALERCHFRVTSFAVTAVTPAANPALNGILTDVPFFVMRIFPLVNDQLDAQLLYFMIRLLQSYTCFEQRRAHHQEFKIY